jgi:hypothetical protein
MIADRYLCDLLAEPRLVHLILSRPDVFPPVSSESQPIIRSCVANVEQARCRAVARAILWGELWQVEITS